jgi:hypothetical protein
MGILVVIAVFALRNQRDTRIIRNLSCARVFHEGALKQVDYRRTRMKIRA